jgi:hypothetical protein
MKTVRPAIRNGINFVAFYVGWAVCVMAGAAGATLISLTFATVVIALHLALTPRPGREAAIVATLGVTGYAIDSLITGAGAYTFVGPRFLGVGAPIWIIGLWAMFATTLNASLAWLRANLAMAAVFGLVGGPLAFLAGAKLGAIEVTTGGYVAGAIFYALATPLFLAVASRWTVEAPVAATTSGTPAGESDAAPPTS